MSDCYLRGNCPCQSGACGTEPDDGCPVFRYFDELILRQRERMTKKATATAPAAKGGSALMNTKTYDHDKGEY